MSKLLDSLIDVVGMPVGLLLAIPEACGVVGRRLLMLVMETQEKMGPTDYVLGVEKAESAVLKARDGFDAI